MTEQARGYRTQTMIDFETAFKTPPATASGIILPFNTNSVVCTQTLNDPGTITGTRNPVSPLHGNKTVDGELALPLGYRSSGYLFKGLFGAPTTTAVEGSEGLYQHVFKVGDNQPSMIIQKAFLDIGKYFKYSGCKISSLKLPFGSDSEAILTAGIMGATEVIGESTYDASAKIVTLDRAEQFQASVEENDTGIVSLIKTGEINIDAGLDGEQYCVGDEGTRGDIPESILNIKGTMSILFKGTTYIEKAKNGTKAKFKLLYTKGTHSLSLLFPEIIYEQSSPAIQGKAGVLCDCNWRAFYESDTNKSAVIATLINDVASY